MKSLFTVAALSLVAVSAQAARPLSLGAALALAKQRRSEVVAAEIDLRRARLNVLRAQLERVHLTIQASFTERLQVQNVYGADACSLSALCSGEGHPFSASAALRVPLWSGLTVEADLAGAHARERAARAGRSAAANGIGLDAALAYWEVRRADLASDVARHAVERTREIERTAKIKVDAHIAPEVDYDRAHLQSLRQAERLAALEAQRTAARAALAAALQVDDEVEPTDEPGAASPALPPLAEVLEEALRGRSELAAGRATVEAEQQSVRAAKGGYWPQLALVGLATAENRFLPVLDGTMPDPRERFVITALAGLRVDWVMFDTLTTWTAVRDAGYVRDRAVAELERVRHQVRAEVTTAHARLAAALQRRALAVDAATAARRSLFLLQKRYQVGDALLLEVILAQQELTEAEGELSDAAIDTAEGEAQLQAAMGRL